MKKILALCLSSALVVALSGPAASARKKEKKRKEVASYVAPTIGYYTPTVLRAGGVCDSTLRIGCAVFEILPHEDLIRVAVHDAAGGPVAGVVWQAGPSGYEIIGEFCSVTEVPIRSRYEGEPVSVNVYPGTCLDGSPSVVTQGTIEVTFSEER